MFFNRFSSLFGSWPGCPGTPRGGRNLTWPELRPGPPGPEFLRKNYAFRVVFSENRIHSRVLAGFLEKRRVSRVFSRPDVPGAAPAQFRARSILGRPGARKIASGLAPAGASSELRRERPGPAWPRKNKAFRVFFSEKARQNAGFSAMDAISRETLRDFANLLPKKRVFA